MQLLSAPAAAAPPPRPSWRAPARVLMLDSRPMGAPYPMSTHFIHGNGMAVLDELGVGEPIRARTPVSRRGRFSYDHRVAYVPVPAGHDAYCARRSLVDPLLQQAAIDAGAVFRDHCRVSDLLWDGDRVTGVIAAGAEGPERLHSDIVIGADGRNSVVARKTGVETYLDEPAQRGAYWTYIPKPALWDQDDRYRDIDFCLEWIGDDLRYVFQCDDDLLIVIASPPAAVVQAWGQNGAARALDFLRVSPVTGPLVAAASDFSAFHCVMNLRFYYRRPVGPGFALVGDAGNFKDPVIGYGMSDAFCGGRALADAVLDGSEAAMQRYWRQRDVDTVPLYSEGLRLGRIDANNAFIRALWPRVARRPALAGRLGESIAKLCLPWDVFGMPDLLATLGSGLVRGNFAALPAFLEIGRRQGFWKAELERRQALLRNVSEETTNPHVTTTPPIPAHAGVE